MGSKSLTFIGVGMAEDDKSVQFMYTDPEQDLHQQVNFNLRYYKGFQCWEPLMEFLHKRSEAERRKHAKNEDPMMKENSEEWKEDPGIKYKDGIYIFMPKKDEQESK